MILLDDCDDICKYLVHPDLAPTQYGLQGFVKESSRRIVIEGKTPAEVIDKLIAFNRKCTPQQHAVMGQPHGWHLFPEAHEAWLHIALLSGCCKSLLVCNAFLLLQQCTVAEQVKVDKEHIEHSCVEGLYI